MAICPSTFTACWDDLCYGGGCFKMSGEPMLKLCPGGCGMFVAIDGSDSDDCLCDPDCDDREEEEDTP